MSVIIRLQRLPLSATAADIRDLFRGLTIPEGGVHIVGGSEGDAFIAFASDEDARVAINEKSGKKIKGSRIKLLLSSRVEMGKVIEKARTEYTMSAANGSYPVPTRTDAERSRSRSRRRSRSRERTSRRRRSSKSRSRTRSRSPVRSARSSRRRSDEVREEARSSSRRLGSSDRSRPQIDPHYPPPPTAQGGNSISPRGAGAGGYGYPPAPAAPDSTPYYEKYPASAINPPGVTASTGAESSAYTRRPEEVTTLPTHSSSSSFKNPWLAVNATHPPETAVSYSATIGTPQVKTSEPVPAAPTGYNASFESTPVTVPDWGNRMHAASTQQIASIGPPPDFHNMGQRPPDFYGGPPPKPPEFRGGPVPADLGSTAYQASMASGPSSKPTQVNQPSHSESPIPGEYDRGGYQGSIMDSYSGGSGGYQSRYPHHTSHDRRHQAPATNQYHATVSTSAGATVDTIPTTGAPPAQGGYNASFDESRSPLKFQSTPKDSPPFPPRQPGPPVDRDPTYHSGIQVRPPIESSGPPFQYGDKPLIRPPMQGEAAAPRRSTRAPLLAAPSEETVEPPNNRNERPPFRNGPQPPPSQMGDMSGAGPREGLLSHPLNRKVLTPPPAFPDFSGNEGGRGPRIPFNMPPLPPPPGHFGGRPGFPPPPPPAGFLPRGNVSKPISLLSDRIPTPPGVAIRFEDVTTFVRIRNTPPHLLDYSAIREAVRPVQIRGRRSIKIQFGPDGHKTGDMLINFACRADSAFALDKLRREHHVDIESINEQSFEDGTDGPLDTGSVACPAPTLAGLIPTANFPGPSLNAPGSLGPSGNRVPLMNDEESSGHFILLMGNMPYRMGKSDIMDFLYQHRIRTSDDVLQVEIEYGKMNRKPTGRAYIEVSSAEAMKAILELNTSDFGGRTVHFSVSDPDTMENATGARPIKRGGNPAAALARNMMGANLDLAGPANSQSSSSLNSSKQANPPLVIEDEPDGGDNTCIHMTGLPQAVSERDILSFFEGFRIVPGGTGIRLMYEPPGSAYVEFCQPSEVGRAVKKNRQFIGTRPVNIRACTKQELNEAVQFQFTSSAMRANGGAPTAGQNVGAQSKPASLLQMPPGPLSYQNYQTVSAPRIDPRRIASVQKDPEKSTEGLVDSPMSPTVQQHGASDASKLSTVPRSGQNNNEEHSGKKLENVVQPMSRRPPIDENIIRQIGPVGCVLAMHQLPSSITLEEICDLYKGFQVLDDTVRMHYNPNGQPTGDCLLSVKTSEEAARAAAKLNGTKVGGNTLEVYVAKVK